MMGLSEPLPPGPLPCPAGDPPPEAWCPARTPPAGLLYLGARATERAWMVPCPSCLEGWLSLLPSGSAFGYRPAVSIGCSRGCPDFEVAFWWFWRAGDLRGLRRLAPPPEPEPEARVEAPAAPQVAFAGGEVDPARVVEAMRRSLPAQRVWTGEWYARRPDLAHRQLVRGLVRAGLRQPDALRAALHAYERARGRDPALSLPDARAAAAIADGIGGRRP